MEERCFWFSFSRIHTHKKEISHYPAKGGYYFLLRVVRRTFSGLHSVTDESGFVCSLLHFSQLLIMMKTLILLTIGISFHLLAGKLSGFALSTYLIVYILFYLFVCLFRPVFLLSSPLLSSPFLSSPLSSPALPCPPLPSPPLPSSPLLSPPLLSSPVPSPPLLSSPLLSSPSSLVFLSNSVLVLGVLALALALVLIVVFVRVPKMAPP